MKKKKIDLVGHICDNVMWYAIYLLPLILMVLYWFKTGTTTLSNVIELAGLSFVTDNIVYTTLNSVFGVGGVFAVFANNDLLIYFSYFICVAIIHLIIDILLYIVRLCHNVVNHGLGGASHE